MKGEIYLHPRVRSRVLSQIVDWKPMKIDNTDDIIDPIGYVDEFVQDYGHLMVKTIFDEDVVICRVLSLSSLAVLTNQDYQLPWLQ